MKPALVSTSEPARIDVGERAADVHDGRARVGCTLHAEGDAAHEVAIRAPEPLGPDDGAVVSVSNDENVRESDALKRHAIGERGDPVELPHGIRVPFGRDGDVVGGVTRRAAGAPGPDEVSLRGEPGEVGVAAAQPDERRVARFGFAGEAAREVDVAPVDRYGHTSGHVLLRAADPPDPLEVPGPVVLGEEGVEVAERGESGVGVCAAVERGDPGEGASHVNLLGRSVERGAGSYGFAEVVEHVGPGAARPLRRPLHVELGDKRIAVASARDGDAVPEVDAPLEGAHDERVALAIDGYGFRDVTAGAAERISRFVGLGCGGEGDEDRGKEEREGALGGTG